MPKNKIEKLMDEDDPMDVDRAETVAKVAQVVINSAKVEVDFLKQTGQGSSGFISNQQPSQRRLAAVPSEPQIVVTKETPKEELCLNCTLPDCDEDSPHCLVQIQRKAA
jgi:hypothetical protein